MFGVGLHMLVAYLLFLHPLPAGQSINAALTKRFYRWTRRYPWWVALASGLIPLVAYGLGSLQLALFADWSRFEYIKNLFYGESLGLLYSAMLYLLLQLQMISLRDEVVMPPLLSSGLRTSLRNRIGLVAALVSFASIVLLTLLVINSFQTFVARQTAVDLELVVARVQRQLRSASASLRRDTILEELRIGRRGEVFVMRDLTDPPWPVSRETRVALISGQEQVIRDFAQDLKLIALFPDPVSDDVIVSVVFLTDLYNQLVRINDVGNFILGSILIVLITILLSALTAVVTTRPLRVLTKVVQRSPRVGQSMSGSLYTGDEIEILARGFFRYLGRTRKLQSGLEKQAEQLKQAIAKKGEFLNIAAHELRTPLQPIIGYTNRLLGKSDLPKWHREKLEIILLSGERLLRLVQDVLYVNELETGAIKFTMEQIDLVVLLKEVHELFGSAVTKKELALSLDVPESLPGIQGDAQRLKQVFNNLMTNAIKFTETGSVRVTARAEATMVVVSVADTGVGIAQEHLPKLFTKFYQVESSLKHTHEGTGLGLAIVKVIIEAHKGEVSVESTVGKGSTFQVTLPTIA